MISDNFRKAVAMSDSALSHARGSSRAAWVVTGNRPTGLRLLIFGLLVVLAAGCSGQGNDQTPGAKPALPDATSMIDDRGLST